MVQLSSLLAGFAITLATSAMPLTIPLGSTGQTLTISADGQSISVDDQTVNLRRAMSAGASCSTGKKGGHKGAGAGAGAGKGGAAAAANSTAAATTNANAIYFMTNAANNSIVALKIAADGTLSDGSITATGGAGMNGVDSTDAPAAPDALFSQGAVKVAGSVRLSLFQNPDLN
jgi:hypothetical protein